MTFQRLLCLLRVSRKSDPWPGNVGADGRSKPRFRLASFIISSCSGATLGGIGESWTEDVAEDSVPSTSESASVAAGGGFTLYISFCKLRPRERYTIGGLPGRARTSEFFFFLDIPRAIGEVENFGCGSS